ncbi:hypothetical protein RGU70_13635 [Herbaspirillum sp. RTI4]|uniref:hypothetical protein n=1 Tax=Herbaspirillum sp. RTI4 TaxID=3048640 RepID=UPI002AB5A655|nr:hypothetical protein [Herbaspirillum sp. RTI4]MDY7579355.1 hypothetical protein [Herbaspirillum sp. RTI4]MEA9980269.1 hypothetical protein [Herbaspirillum sp. RTI4]
MAQVRALTTLFHNGMLVNAGDVFEYADDLAKKLKGEVSEGMELVTKKSNAAFAKVQADAQKTLEDTEAALRTHFNALKAELDADPTRGDLVQKVLDAETAVSDAAKAVAAGAATNESELV